MAGTEDLTVMTLNVEGYSSFPADEAAGARRLREITDLQDIPPDILCTQEGRDGREDILGQVCEALGYVKLQSSFRDDLHGRSGALCVNQIFMRRDCMWEAIGTGMEVVSSEDDPNVLDLDNGHDIPVRTCSWVQLKPRHRATEDGLSIFLYNLHLTGGHFEDAHFLRGLAQERKLQPERCIAKFMTVARPCDVGLLVGDFNASSKYEADGPMQSYFKSVIVDGYYARADASALGLSPQDLEPEFEKYMVAPFRAIEEQNWKLAYDEGDIGPTSTFGHLVDHMAVSDSRVVSKHVERLATTNQCNGTSEDTKVPITDHNAVKVTFDLSQVLTDIAWHTGGEDKGNGLKPVAEDCLARGDAGIDKWVSDKLSNEIERDMSMSVLGAPPTPRSIGDVSGF